MVWVIAQPDKPYAGVELMTWNNAIHFSNINFLAVHRMCIISEDRVSLSSKLVEPHPKPLSLPNVNQPIARLKESSIRTKKFGAN